MVFMRFGKIFIISTLLLIAAAPCTQGRELLDSICSLGLPVMCIETVDHEEPTCDYISHPAGAMGMGITNATKVPMSVNIVDWRSGDVIYDSGPYVDGVSGATIKIRGNSSAYAAKKPYKIKLQKKGDMLARGDKRYSDKNWILISDNDVTTLFGVIISRVMGMTWTPQGLYVNVIFNGDYRGMYLLTEQVKRNNDCRLVTEKSGFIVEHDPYWWVDDEPYIVSAVHNPSYNYTYKYPEPEDVTEEQAEYISTYMNAFDQSVLNGTYPDYIDAASLANWLLAHDILGIQDSGGTNKYFLKADDSDSTVLEMPLLWDFDSAMKTAGTWCRIHTGSFGRNYFSNSNKTMVRAYQRRWHFVSATLYQEVMSRFDAFVASEQGRGFALSRTADNTRWATQFTTLNNFRTRLDSWMSSRVAFLNANVPALHNNPYADGDVNEDGTIDGIDLNMVINHILGVEKAPVPADCNGDARIDAIDLNIVINGVLQRQ